MTKRELIEALEATACPDETDVVACVMDGCYVESVECSPAREKDGTVKQVILLS